MGIVLLKFDRGYQTSKLVTAMMCELANVDLNQPDSSMYNRKTTDYSQVSSRTQSGNNFSEPYAVQT